MLEAHPYILTRLRRLPKGLRAHIERVRAIALQLAEKHRLDIERVDLASASHDLARATRGDVLLSEAQRFGLSLHLVEERMPILLHGPVATQWLQREDGLKDAEVLHAVHWHSTASGGMGPISKVVFLSDKLDPEKARRYPYQGEINSLAFEDLDEAILQFLTHEMERFLAEGGLIHPASLEARNELLVAKSGSRQHSRRLLSSWQ